MNRVELLAPAGNFECLKAAINNGANAVYLGGKNFSARAFANNFDENELIEAVQYAHLRDVKIYVTLNTLLTEKEFNNAIKMVDFYYKNKVDALLIQDLGLFYYLKKNYPDFELHCSTQMHVHNLSGVQNAKKLGFKRVVLARESNLELIKQASKLGIEIETFVHGAICVSYSGQCLMSSVTKNRSANKGMCAQCCRLRYELYDQNNNCIPMDSQYPLSTKDMFLLEDIPQLIEAGVSSFKIEGRLKSSAYVGYVTRMYRKAIDSYYEHKEFKLTQEELNNLKVLFNRNFTDDYLFNRNNLFGQSSPNHLGIEIGSVISSKNGMTYIRLSKPLNQFDGIRINDFGCICNMIYKDGLLVSNGEVGDLIAIKSEQILSGPVYKTLDFKLEEEIHSCVDKRIPLNINVSIYNNSNVLVTINDFQYKSSIIAQKALKAPLTKDSIINQFSKLNDTCFCIGNINIETDNDSFLPIKQLNDIRRSAIEEYSKCKLNSFHRYEIKNMVEYQKLEPESCFSSELIINENSPINYVINQDSKYIEGDNAIICEFGGLLSSYKHKTAYYTLNCCNSYAYEFLKKLGYKEVILSSELNELNINDLKEAYKERNQLDIHPYLLKQGYRVLMYIKANPFDKYMENNKKYYLKDHNNRYFIRKNHSITELIQIDENTNIELLDNKQVFTII